MENCICIYAKHFRLELALISPIFSDKVADIFWHVVQHPVEKTKNAHFSNWTALDKETQFIFRPFVDPR
jgi:hypothetical protein